MSYAAPTEEMVKVTELAQRAMKKGTMRSAEEIAGLFGDLELLEPGLVTVTRWRPDETPVPPELLEVPLLGGLARKR
ncbi:MULTISPECIES: SAM-dependent methyltransferase [Actinomadura]|uniref:SAM-dependent methyltransferase n=1 Tax=Actinomadura yumaensis TaxID=111807 RepID=A0ABW2CDM1_9ACTN|nr:SAM-dependent methyltransferase [Actinomadura sp. J1-007]